MDYHDSFSPVAKLVTVRLLFAIATTIGWPLHQIDINNAYLHGYLDEEVYLEPPPGYDKCPTGHVCQLIKSFCGLKQAERQ